MTFLYKYHHLIGEAISARANIEEWLKSTLKIDEITQNNAKEAIDFLKTYIKSKSNTSDIKFRIVVYPVASTEKATKDFIEFVKEKLNKIDNSFIDSDQTTLNSEVLNVILSNKIEELNITAKKCLISSFCEYKNLKSLYEINGYDKDADLSILANEFASFFYVIFSDNLDKLRLSFNKIPVDDIDDLFQVLYFEKHFEVFKDVTEKLDLIQDELNNRKNILPEKIKTLYLDYFNRIETILNIFFNACVGAYSEAITFISDYIEHLLTDEPFKTSAYEKDVCSMYEYPPIVRSYLSDESLYEMFNKNKSIEDALPGSGMNFGKRELQSSQMMKPQYAINDIEKKYESKFKKVDSIIVELLHVKPQKLKNKLNAMYFKKWLGRIPGMYNSYGNEARITENRMKGDPTVILSETAPAYLEKTATETNSLFQEIINLSKRITASSDIRQKMNHVKSFCTTYKLEDPTNPKEVEKTIKNECLYRICKCIFQGNQIYGYTPEGIVENGKFPTANHIITSLFIENAHEQPEPQAVSQIFSSPESMSTYAYPEKLINYENLLKKVTSSVSQNFNRKMLSSVHNGLELNFKNYSNSLVRKSSEINGDDAENAKANKKIAKAIENGIVAGLDLIIDQKMRVMQCVGCCYDMLGRVQRLAKLCVAALHQVEMQHSDSRHQAGVNNITRNATNVRLNRINNANNKGYIQQ